MITLAVPNAPERPDTSLRSAQPCSHSDQILRLRNLSKASGAVQVALEKAVKCFDSMATLEKKCMREHRSRWRYLDWFYLASALICLFVSLSTGMTLGQEVQQETHHEARAWLEFNHHVGGIAVLVLASLTWLEVLGIGPAMAIKLGWPSCLILIGLYNLVLSDRFAWPIGPSGVVASLSNPKVLQHKVLAVMVLTLGVIDLLRRLGRATHRSLAVCVLCCGPADRGHPPDARFRHRSPRAPPRAHG